MRRHLAVSILLAACVVASAAIAAPDRIVATFETLGASSVAGEAAISPLPNGGVMVHAQLRGLEPNTEYVALIFDASQTCADGTSSLQVVAFTSNPAGIATWNEKVERDLSAIQSIGVRTQPENTLVACASVTQ
jgi:hypothetical protein